MDHFEQGLRGDIRSMIAGQTFENCHEMYQRAIKIARVLEESKMEKQALEARKERWGHLEGDFLVTRNSDMVTIQGKGKQPVEGRTIPKCET